MITFSFLSEAQEDVYYKNSDAQVSFPLMAALSSTFSQWKILEVAHIIFHILLVRTNPMVTPEYKQD